MLARNHVFTLLSMENDRSPVPLVAGSTNRSLQITIRQDKTRQLYLTRVAQSAARLVSLGALGTLSCISRDDRYHVSLVISKTLNRFQNIGKAINLPILDQHFQNLELGKKISSSYIVSIISFHVVHL